MSASPSKDGEGAGDASPENSDQMERGEEAQAREAYDFDVKEQDRWLPIANVARIMKTALPDNAKIAKEAKECMQECVSEFISFITSEASEKCQQEKRKTVNGEDILFAMTSTGFENYAEALKIYLAKYRESQSQRGEGQSGPPQQAPGASFGGAPPATIQNPQATAGFQGQDAGVEHMMAPHGLQGGPQEGAYGGAYPAASANNGVTGENY